MRIPRLPWRRPHSTRDATRAATRDATTEDAVREIRATLAAFGFPTTDLSDQQIEAGVVQFSQLAATSGVTMRQAADGLWLVVEAVNHDH